MRRMWRGSAQRLVPDLAGISVASREHGLTFTLVATDEEIAALDGGAVPEQWPVS
jgi:hypothetical protein